MAKRPSTSGTQLEMWKEHFKVVIAAVLRRSGYSQGELRPTSFPRRQEPSRAEIGRDLRNVEGLSGDLRALSKKSKYRKLFEEEGQLGVLFEALQSALSSVVFHRQYQMNQILNAPKKFKGPEPVPYPIAKEILRIIELLKGDSRLVTLHSFLAPKGDLEKWIKKSFSPALKTDGLPFGLQESASGTHWANNLKERLLTSIGYVQIKKKRGPEFTSWRKAFLSDVVKEPMAVDGKFIHTAPIWHEISINRPERLNYESRHTKKRSTS